MLRDDLASLVRKQLARQESGQAEPEPIKDPERFQPKDPAMFIVADGLRRILHDTDLQRLLESETDPDKLRLFLLADCFLQYHSSSDVRQAFLSKVREGTNLGEAVRYAALADFIVASMGRLSETAVIRRLQKETDVSQVAAKLSAYLFVDYYLTLSQTTRNDPVVKMLEDERQVDISQIARYVAQRTALAELTGTLQSEIAIQRLNADPHEGFKALVFLDYYISRIDEPAAKEEVLRFIAANSSLDELAVYAAATFTVQNFFTALGKNEVITGFERPSLENLKALLIVDYFAALTGRKDIKDILAGAAKAGKSLDAIVETASLAVAGRLNSNEIERLTQEVVVPALKDEVREEIRQGRPYLEEEERQRQHLASERRIAHDNFVDRLKTALRIGGIAIGASVVVGGIAATLIWEAAVWGPTQVEEEKVAKAPYEEILKPENVALVERLSLEYQLLTTAFSPDYARQTFLGKIAGLEKNANTEEIGGLMYVLSQDSLLVGREQLNYFRDKKFQAYNRFVNSLQGEQSAREEAERQRLQQIPADTASRKLYLTDRIGEMMAAYRITGSHDRATLLEKINENIEAIAEQQGVFQNALATIQAQGISLDAKDLKEEEQQAVTSYHSSLDIINQNMQTIMQSIMETTTMQ